MSKNGAVFRAGSAVAFARLFSLACAAVQLPLLTRSLGPAEYSEVALAIAVATYFNLLSSEPVILAFERFPGSAIVRNNYRFAMSRSLLCIGVATVVVVAGAAALGQVGHAIAFSGWGIGIAINRLISLTWLMWEKPWQYTWNLVAGTGTRTLVLVLLIVMGWSPQLSLGMAGLASALAALTLSPRVRFSRSDWKRKLSAPWPPRFGIKLTLGALGYALLSNASLLLLAAFVPKSSVGPYAAMMQIATLSSAAVLGLVQAVTYPPLRRDWDAGLSAEVQAKLGTLQVVCVAVAAWTVFACFVGDFFFLRLAIPASFIRPDVLAPLVMATGLATMGGMASWHHQLELRAGRVATRTALAAAIAVAATLVLTAVWAEQGSAFGSVVGFAAYLAIMQFGTGLPIRTAVFAYASVALVSLPLIQPRGFGGESFITWAALAITVVSLELARRSRRIAFPSSTTS